MLGTTQSVYLGRTTVPLVVSCPGLIPTSWVKKPKYTLSDSPSLRVQSQTLIKLRLLIEPITDLMGGVSPARNTEHPSAFRHLQSGEMMYGEGFSDGKGLYVRGPTTCRELLASVSSDSKTSASWAPGTWLHCTAWYTQLTGNLQL